MFRELLKSLRMFGPRYEVSCGGYASGFFKRFYRYATAKAYYEQVKHSYPSVSLVDLATPSSLLERQSNREKRQRTGTARPRLCVRRKTLRPLTGLVAESDGWFPERTNAAVGENSPQTNATLAITNIRGSQVRILSRPILLFYRKATACPKYLPLAIES
jgi:hypothetical protein